MHDESRYVVRRADGTPLSVPAWMTQPDAACLEPGATARLPVCVLLELRRSAVSWLSSLLREAHEEN